VYIHAVLAVVENAANPNAEKNGKQNLQAMEDKMRYRQTLVVPCRTLFAHILSACCSIIWDARH